MEDDSMEEGFLYMWLKLRFKEKFEYEMKNKKNSGHNNRKEIELTESIYMLKSRILQRTNIVYECLFFGNSLRI